MNQIIHDTLWNMDVFDWITFIVICFAAGYARGYLKDQLKKITK